MIQFDQPTIFQDKIVAAVSSVEDGDMKFGDSLAAEVAGNREQFLTGMEVDPTQTTLINVSYEDNTDFTRYVVFDDDQQGEGMLSPSNEAHADAAIVTRPGHAIFLPLADCVGAIIYDPVNMILMVSHLGRHSLEQLGGSKTIHYMVDEFESNPSELLVWLSPGVGPDTYPLQTFAGKGLHEVAIEQLLGAGVLPAGIEVSPVDTAASADYFSHSQFKQGNRSEDGRFAIVAMMRD